MGASIVVYLGTVKLLKVEEVEYVWSAVKRRLSRRPVEKADEDVEPMDIGPPDVS